MRRVAVAIVFLIVSPLLATNQKGAGGTSSQDHRIGREVAAPRHLAGEVTCRRALSYKGVTTTDQNGHYSISGVPFGGIGVVAIIDGAQVAAGGSVVRSGDSATLDLHAPLNQPKSLPSSMFNGAPWIVAPGMLAGTVF